MVASLALRWRFGTASKGSFGISSGVVGAEVNSDDEDTRGESVTDSVESSEEC